MQRAIVLVLLGASCIFAQSEDHPIVITGTRSVAAVAGFGPVSAAPVQGAPYTATVTNESVQTLADGNRIVQTSNGTIARDSMGRTRQDAPLPMIANMAPANAPHIVFIHDPVAQTSYTLNLTEKTATKMPAMMSTMPPPLPPTLAASDSAAGGGIGGVVTIRAQGAGSFGVQTFGIAKSGLAESSAKPQTEDLGSQTMEGVLVNGTRTTYTIPAGQIGNDQAISIVTEVWTSPELKTIIYSKRSDPRMGDQTFKLTNIVRAEPDPTLFTVPSDFKITDGPRPIQYIDARPAP
ncbi:MAG TPA: hypothetical protein VME17_10765 [Bryobacteraceae bacterium]|nr:hypothetical protein [Bryobacteraceae bacterium]